VIKFHLENKPFHISCQERSTRSILSSFPQLCFPEPSASRNHQECKLIDLMDFSNQNEQEKCRPTEANDSHKHNDFQLFKKKPEVSNKQNKITPSDRDNCKRNVWLRKKEIKIL
jgi:hypothetical protein